MKNRKLSSFILVMAVLSLTGCSLLNLAGQPFKNKIVKVPEAIEKSERKVRCKGEITIGTDGEITKCTQQYSSDEKNFTQKERKLNFREKVSQFILNIKGYLLWMIIIGVVLSLSGFGWILGAIVSGLRGVGRVSRDLVKGISSGKNYVRDNGNSFNDKEKRAYQKGVDDMLFKISESLSSKASKKIVNKLRAEN